MKQNPNIPGLERLSYMTGGDRALAALIHDILIEEYSKVGFIDAKARRALRRIAQVWPAAESVRRYRRGTNTFMYVNVADSYAPTIVIKDDGWGAISVTPIIFESGARTNSGRPTRGRLASGRPTSGRHVETPRRKNPFTSSGWLEVNFVATSAGGEERMRWDAHEPDEGSGKSEEAEIAERLRSALDAWLDSDGEPGDVVTIQFGEKRTQHVVQSSGSALANGVESEMIYLEPAWDPRVEGTRRNYIWLTGDQRERHEGERPVEARRDRKWYVHADKPPRGRSWADESDRYVSAVFDDESAAEKWAEWLLNQTVKMMGWEPEILVTRETKNPWGDPNQD
jgi:hypothetical protein